jgi:hypothetical protein
MVDGVSAFADDVRDRSFPAPEHGYSIDHDELTAFRGDSSAQTRSEQFRD